MRSYEKDLWCCSTPLRGERERIVCLQAVKYLVFETLCRLLFRGWTLDFLNVKPSRFSPSRDLQRRCNKWSFVWAQHVCSQITPLDYYLNRCRARTAAWLGCLDHLIIVKRRRSVWKYLATFSWCSDLQQHVVSWKLPTANITSTCKDNMEHSSPRKSKLHIFPLLLLLFIQVD